MADAEHDLGSTERAQLASCARGTNLDLDVLERFGRDPATACPHRSVIDCRPTVGSTFRRIVRPVPPFRIATDAFDTDLGKILKVSRELSRH
jgi:hypothetical protein